MAKATSRFILYSQPQPGKFASGVAAKWQLLTRKSDPRRHPQSFYQIDHSILHTVLANPIAIPTACRGSKLYFPVNEERIRMIEIYRDVSVLTKEPFGFLTACKVYDVLHNSNGHITAVTWPPNQIRITLNYESMDSLFYGTPCKFWQGPIGTRNVSICVYDMLLNSNAHITTSRCIFWQHCVNHNCGF